MKQFFSMTFTLLLIAAFLPAAAFAAEPAKAVQADAAVAPVTDAELAEIFAELTPEAEDKSASTGNADCCSDMEILQCGMYCAQQPQTCTDAPYCDSGGTCHCACECL